MTMIISQANSMRFRKVNSDLPNFDNTLTANEKFYNDTIETYCQRFNTSDVEPVQIKSDSAVVPTIVAVSDDNSTASIVCVGNSYITRYDTNGGTNYNLWFFEFQLPMSNYLTETYVTVTQGTDVYISEPFRGDIEIDSELANGETLQIKYSNNDNAFQIDFSTLITFTLYIKSIIKDYESGGDISVYDNQDEIEKLKETAKRIFSLKTLPIPRYLAETLKLASSMDNLVINDVAFVRVDQPEISPIDGNNLVEFSMAVTDKEYLGVNTHDIGFDVDLIPGGGDEMIILSKNSATGSETFVVTAGYLVHTLRANWVSGTTVLVKLGTTVGGDELVYGFPMSASIVNITVAIHGDINRASNANIYLTVAGGVVDVDIQTLKNIQ